MAQAVKPTALVVENDEVQRTLASMLLEEDEMYVIQCDSAEAAVHVLNQSGGRLSIILTDVELAGTMDGIELACIARERFPDLHIIVTSVTPRIRRLPDGTIFMAKPWSATDILLEARAVRSEALCGRAKSGSPRPIVARSTFAEELVPRICMPGTGNHRAVSAFNPTILYPREIDPMGQSKPLRATALIVEDDPMQRQMICLLLEESDYDVIQCESAEAAQFVLERNGGSLWLMITDVKLAGQMDGVELAHIAKEHVPDLEVIVTSGKPLRQALPEGAKFWSKPWVPLDVIREAERMSVSHRTDDNA